MINRNILELLLYDYKKYKFFIRDAVGLYLHLNKFQDHAEKLLLSPGSILNDIEEFRRLIKLISEIPLFFELVPKYSEKLISIVLNNSQEFTRLIKNVDNLVWLAQHENMHPDKFISIVLSNQEEFKRLVKDSNDLKFLSYFYPEHSDIFKQPSIEKAIKIVRMRTKIEKAYTLGATFGTFFNHPLCEVSPYIASFLDRKDGAQLASINHLAYEVAEAEREIVKRKSMKN
jgi:hypothetical protein